MNLKFLLCKEQQLVKIELLHGSQLILIGVYEKNEEESLVFEEQF
jgi:hypothetical protein